MTFEQPSKSFGIGLAPLLDLFIDPGAQDDFYNLMRQGKLRLPTQDVEADMYQDAIDLMEAHGRHQYEISNFAKTGYQCRHNLLYWQNDKYFGFGAGAFGYLGRDRYHNYGPIKQYLAPLHADHLPVLAHHLVPVSEQIEEEMFLAYAPWQASMKIVFIAAII